MMLIAVLTLAAQLSVTMSSDMNGDIRDFFRAVASISGHEVDVDPSINRTVTLHLKNIPWELALDVVVRNSGLASTLDGNVLHITMANPLLGEDRLLLGTVTLEGNVTEFNLEGPRALIQVRAPNAEGTMQVWPVEWESTGYLKEIGIRPNTLKPGDPLIVTGNITRTNTIRLVTMQRPSDGFSWGSLNVVRSTSRDGVMFVSSAAK
jgi:hypothetical protein